MVLSTKISLKGMKVSRVVLVSGFLTFLYFIEFCIGIRTVYYTFRIWNRSYSDSQHKPVSWPLCVACLFTAVISSFAINVLSAMWEQKQLEEREKGKSAIRFAFHIMVGGMIWRYISLWCIETKEFQKKGALLLTMTKFLFTQTFTIPLVIVHVSVVDHLEEIIFDVCSIACISINLILTCTLFSWCSKEVEELKKWDFETVDLVPLIFQADVPVEEAPSSEISANSSNKEIQRKTDKSKMCNFKGIEIGFVKFVVLLQTFGFSFGRLLALGILLKLAGIYAVSIMFLQLLISVIYLKFQTPILVSDSLPKWRQLSRLAFMSYILIFEWHLNRSPRTGYDISSNIKHSILYYCIATAESVFYLITWAVTTSYSTKFEFVDISNHKNKFCRIILILGTMALIFSLMIHIILLLWRSRRFSIFFYTVRRRYETAKLRLSLHGCKKDDETKDKRPARSHIDISSPIPIKKNEDIKESQDTCKTLEKHNSYMDLREPVDEEIEIYFKKCENQTENYEDKMNDAKYMPDEANNINSEKRFERELDMEINEAKYMPDEASNLSPEKTFTRKLNMELNQEVNNSHQRNVRDDKTVHIDTNTPVELDAVIEENETKTKAKAEKCADNFVQAKVSAISSSISEQWGKFTSVSQKFTGNMKEQIQKRKQQLQNIRSNSTSDSRKDAESKTDHLQKTKDSNEVSHSGAHTSVNVAEETEGYFVGDSRYYQDVNFQSMTAVSKQEIDDNILPHSDINHKEGDSPCPCYVCRILGDGRFRRRKSSSVPPADWKLKQEDEEDKFENKTLPRYLSSPNISHSRCEKVNSKDGKVSPTSVPKSIYNLNALSLGHRVEHYV